MTDTLSALVAQPDDSRPPVLHGSQCSLCGEVVFPPMRDCPLCMQPDVMRGRDMVGHGTLREFVLSERGADGFAVPYVQAYVQLDDGPVVFSTIETSDPRKFGAPPGSPMTMVLRRFDSTEPAFVGWKFVLDSSELVVTADD